MPQPTAYTRKYDFANYQTSNPTDPVPADQLETEFNAVKQTTDEALANLALIQRDDGKLKNSTVHADSLSAAVRALTLTEMNPRGNWATSTSYAVKDVVEQGGTGYLCMAAHTSGTFDDDYDAGKWLSLGTAEADVSDYRVVATGSGTARTLADHLATLPDAQITATGTTTPRTLADHLGILLDAEIDRGEVNVISATGRPDGSSDNGAALRAVFAGLSAGDVLVIPKTPQPFVLYLDDGADSCEITAPNVTIKGGGKILVKHTDPSSTSGRYPAISVQSSNVTLEDFTIYSEDDPYLYQVNLGINELQGFIDIGQDSTLNPLFNVTVRGMTLLGCENCGIAIRQTWGATIVGNRIEGQSPATAGATSTYGYNHQAITSMGCEAAEISGNLITGFVEGICCGRLININPDFGFGAGVPDDPRSCRDYVITGNRISKWYDHAIYMSVGGANIVSNNVCRGDYTWNQGGSQAIKLTGLNNIIEGNKITGNGGIVVNRIGDSIITEGGSIAGNVIDLMDGESHATNRGIMIGGILAYSVRGNVIRRLRTIETGTAQGAASSTITLAANASAVDDKYNDGTIAIVEGTGAGQSRTISDYEGTSKVATVSSAWSTEPDSTSRYSLSYEIKRYDGNCVGIALTVETPSSTAYPPEKIDVSHNIIYGRFSRGIRGEATTGANRLVGISVSHNDIDLVDNSLTLTYGIDLGNCEDVECSSNRIKNVQRGVNITLGEDVTTRDNCITNYSAFGILCPGSSRSNSSINDRVDGFTGTPTANALFDSSNTRVRMNTSTRKLVPFDEMATISDNAVTSVTVRQDDPRCIVATQSNSPGLTIALDTSSGFLVPGAEFEIINKISGGTADITITGPGGLSETLAQDKTARVRITAANVATLTYMAA